MVKIGMLIPLPLKCALNLKFTPLNILSHTVTRSRKQLCCQQEQVTEHKSWYILQYKKVTSVGDCNTVLMWVFWVAGRRHCSAVGTHGFCSCCVSLKEQMNKGLNESTAADKPHKPSSPHNSLSNTLLHSATSIVSAKLNFERHRQLKTAERYSPTIDPRINSERGERERGRFIRFTDWSTQSLRC